MRELRINGMGCEHCRKAVLEAVHAVPGLQKPEVDLTKGVLRWEETSPVDMEALKGAVRKAGYDPV